MTNLQNIKIDQLFINSSTEQLYLKVSEDKVRKIYPHNYWSEEFDINTLVGEFEISDLPKGDYKDDIYSKGRHLQNPILTDLERYELGIIRENIQQFKLIIKQSIINKDRMFSNGIILRGEPGCGKTYLTRLWLQELIDENYISEFSTLTGKISPISLFGYMSQNESNKVQVLDDCDPWYNNDSLNLLKGALDTRSNEENNRCFSYSTRGQINSKKYESFMIMLTNHKFENPSEHLAAILDRVHLFELPLKKVDMFIQNTSIIEELLNSEEASLNPFLYGKVADFYNEEVREFFEYDAFENCKVNFSVRYVTKVIDLMMNFGEKWKDASVEYKKLRRFTDIEKNKLSQIS